MKNLALVWTPHFNTNCIRAAIKDQQGKDVNYIIVTCSPGCNGIYSWDPKIIPELEVWSNNGNKCYCVPIKCCTEIQTLESVRTPSIQEAIVKSQKEFCKKYRKSEQEWVCKY